MDEEDLGNFLSEEYSAEDLNIPTVDELVNVLTEDGNVTLVSNVPIVDCTPDQGKERNNLCILSNWDDLTPGQEDEALNGVVENGVYLGLGSPNLCLAAEQSLQLPTSELNYSINDDNLNEINFSSIQDHQFDLTPQLSISPSNTTPKTDSTLPTPEPVAEEGTFNQDAGDGLSRPGTKKMRRRDPFKRAVPSATWTRELSKIKRLNGDEYMGHKQVKIGDTKIQVQKSTKPARKMEPRCKEEGGICKGRSCDKISEPQRQLLFDSFWKTMDWDKRLMYVASLVDMKVPKQIKSEVKRASRPFAYFYHLRVDGEKLPVCQRMFLNTFALKFSTVGRWLVKYRSIGNSKEEGGRENETSLDDPETPQIQGAPDAPNMELHVSQRAKSSVKARIAYLRQFLDDFPKLPSHYCRASSKKQYLQTDIRSMSKFYDLYKLKCLEENSTHLSRFVFDQHCKSKNISIFTPRKDQCDECFKYKMGSITEASHEKHINMKNRARKEKEDDKVLAKEKKVYLFCVDVMAVQMLPKIEASVSYYKMKLAIHNYTIYNLEDSDVLNCWFTECDTTLEASTFASLLLAEIERLLSVEVRDVVIFSDGCSYQNKNNVLSNALLALAMKYKVTIHQKYFEKGHSQMEADSVHSLVERSAENLELFMPHEYANVALSARKGTPYRSKLMNFSDFLDYSDPAVLRYDSIRPGNKAHEPTVNELKWLRYKINGTIDFKLDFDDAFQPLPRRPKSHIVGPFNYPPLNTEPIKITKDKYDDLCSLLAHVPHHCRDFYLNLPHLDLSQRKEKRKEASMKQKEVDEETQESGTDIITKKNKGRKMMKQKKIPEESQVSGTSKVKKNKDDRQGTLEQGDVQEELPKKSATRKVSKITDDRKETMEQKKAPEEMKKSVTRKVSKRKDDIKETLEQKKPRKSK